MTNKKPSLQDLEKRIKELELENFNFKSKEIEISEDKAEQHEDVFKSIVNSSPTAMHFYRLENNTQLILADANISADCVL